MLKARFFPMVAGLVLAGCIRVPMGPNVMVLPGTDKSFDEFNFDDAVCRHWAEQQTGITTTQTAKENIAGSAAVGTVLGAATGAAIGAATGSPATGAAVGAGSGLLAGSMVGASSAETAQWTVQHRYDIAYMQCMYANGHQIPVPRGSQVKYTRQAPPPPPGSHSPVDIPPPPAGAPPPPPPRSSSY